MLLLIRRLERTDVAESGPAPPEHAHDLERTEDHVAQNPFTAIGLVKPGRVRHLTMRGVLLGLDYANRHVYNRDNLAGVRTIHFARWVPVDDGRRLIFASSYDGTLESYMDDFIDRLSWGLNAVFSNGMGYPATRWLVLGGAKDETAFKNYLRNHQIVTPVWYSAYDTLPARNVDANSQLRDRPAQRRSRSAPPTSGWRCCEQGEARDATTSRACSPAATDRPALRGVPAARGRGRGRRRAAPSPAGPTQLTTAGQASPATSRSTSRSPRPASRRSRPGSPRAQCLLRAVHDRHDDRLSQPAARRHRDDDPRGWAWGGPGSDAVHVLLLVYADTADRLSTRCAELIGRGRVGRAAAAAPAATRAS